MNAALAVPDGQLAPVEVDILDPKLGTFEQPQSGAVHQRRHQRHWTPQPREQRRHFFTRQNNTEPDRALSPHDVAHPCHPPAEDHFEQEQDRAERLVLRGRAQPANVAPPRSAGCSDAAARPRAPDRAASASPTTRSRCPQRCHLRTACHNSLPACQPDCCPYRRNCKHCREGSWQNLQWLRHARTEELISAATGGRA